ncbi:MULTISPECIES: hypothetical protein [unclassified Carboxylicivirga]|uniref:hypothetical protein n=1 Tax=Carboxylicivirga TaxID=1628153 RepID=UPI003D349DB8
MKIVLVISGLLMALVSCENPYENVSVDKSYTGQPLVMLSSEQAVVRLAASPANHSDIPGLFVDSLILSHKLDHAIMVSLEVVAEATIGSVGEHFSFEQEVEIEAGNYCGSYGVEALDLPLNDISKYQLSVCITSVDDQEVIAGLYGAKKEGEEREKRFKTYSFKK